MKGHAQSRATWAGWAALVAAVAWLGAAIGFAIALPAYSHFVHPLGVLGATGVPHAFAFNLCGFVLPGLLLAWVAFGLRDSLVTDIAILARIGAWLLLFSTLAFALQGVLPLDLDALDAGRSRWHVAAWTVWWLAFVAGAGLFAAGTRRVPALRLLSASVVLVAGLVLLLVLFTPAAWGGAIPQRLAFGAWFGWWLFAARSVPVRSGR